jgi:hypothetical protein
MNLEDAADIYRAIQATRHTPLADDLLKAAVRYARIRADWALASGDEREAMDERRTSAHNAFIDCCNILSRNMARSGEDNAWRALLGDDRKILGDFACHLHCVLGLQAR